MTYLMTADALVRDHSRILPLAVFSNETIFALRICLVKRATFGVWRILAHRSVVRFCACIGRESNSRAKSTIPFAGSGASVHQPNDGFNLVTVEVGVWLCVFGLCGEPREGRGGVEVVVSTGCHGEEVVGLFWSRWCGGGREEVWRAVEEVGRWLVAVFFSNVLWSGHL